MLTGKTVILVRNRFESLHCWPEAPDEVFYLRSMHRHVFHIDSEIEVGHDNRELEFIMVQHAIDDFLKGKSWDFWTSCETIAKTLAKFIYETYGDRDIVVAVREDNEHGAKFTYKRSSRK